MNLLEDCDIAVVIPAYKSRFFEQTLESLANQSDKGFNVYVGDDCSPCDLESIVSRYSDRLHLKYVRFTDNLGASDLVAQWRRCLLMADREAFVCMFSDDDIMMPDCIRDLKRTIAKHPDYDVYHWDIEIIDADSRLIHLPRRWPDVISSSDFFARLYEYKIDARMPEFIFRKEALLQKGFVPFDLAFRTDNATVMLVAQEKGVRNVETDSKILWRNSLMNVSSVVSDEYAVRKAEATVCFFNWTEEFFRGTRFPLPRIRYMKWLIKNAALIGAISGKEKAKEMMQKYTYWSESGAVVRCVMSAHLSVVIWNRVRLRRHRMKKLQKSDTRPKI